MGPNAVLQLGEGGAGRVVVPDRTGGGDVLAEALEVLGDDQADLLVARRPGPQVGGRPAGGARRRFRGRHAGVAISTGDKPGPRLEVAEELVDLVLKGMANRHLTTSLPHLPDGVDDLEEHPLEGGAPIAGRRR